jgi:uncharacterized phage-associated protein
MRPRFREDKATEAAGILLKLRGNKMHHLKLMKLLYIAEREALIRWRRPIIFDRYVSMPHGPVLSLTLNILSGDIETGGPWVQNISSPAQYEVELLKDPGTDSLSQAEVELIQEVYRKYGHMNRFALRDLTHEFQEWQDPEGSSIPIEYADILMAVGKTAIEIKSITDELENLALMDDYLGK